MGVISSARRGKLLTESIIQAVGAECVIYFIYLDVKSILDNCLHVLCLGLYLPFSSDMSLIVPIPTLRHHSHVISCIE